MTMLRCPHCGARLPARAKVCSHCDQPVQQNPFSPPARRLPPCLVAVAGGLALGATTATVLVAALLLLVSSKPGPLEMVPTSTLPLSVTTARPSHTPTPEPPSARSPTDTPVPPTPTDTPTALPPTGTPLPPTPTRRPVPSATPVPPTRTPRPTPTMTCPTLKINVPSAAPAWGIFGIEWDSTSPLPAGWEYALEFRPETCVPSWKCVWTRLPVPLDWWEQGGHLNAQVRGPGEAGIWYWRVCLVNMADPSGPSVCCGEPFRIAH